MLRQVRSWIPVTGIQSPCRLKERAASRKYTPAQEAARGRAADALRQQHSGGWWGGFAEAVSDAFHGAVAAAASHVDGDGDLFRNTKVCTPWSPALRRAGQTATQSPERLQVHCHQRCREKGCGMSAFKKDLMTWPGR